MKLFFFYFQLNQLILNTNCRTQTLESGVEGSRRHRCMEKHTEQATRLAGDWLNNSVGLVLRSLTHTHTLTFSLSLFLCWLTACAVCLCNYGWRPPPVLLLPAQLPVCLCNVYSYVCLCKANTCEQYICCALAECQGDSGSVPKWRQSSMATKLHSAGNS